MTSGNGVNKNGAQSPKDSDSLVLSKLQEMNEKQFTIQVLIPIFKSLGYSRVEYTGGASEEGKDFVCWRQNDLGEPELTVVQVKKYKPSKKAADSRSFSEVITQLSQASEKELPHVDCQTYLPSSVYFISPFPLDTQVLQSRFEAFASLRHRRARVIDGPRILALMKKHLPALVDELCGRQFNVRGSIERQLNNADLLSALDVNSHRSVSSFFTDIDFCLGKKSTRFFFFSQLTPTRVSQTLSAEEWHSLKQLYGIAKNELGVNILATDDTQVEKAVSQQLKRLEEWNQSIREIREKIEEAETLISGVKHQINQKRKELRKRPDLIAIHTRASRLKDELRQLHEQMEKSGTKDLSLEEEQSLVQQITDTHAELDRKDDLYWPLEKSRELFEDQLRHLRTEEELLSNNRPSLGTDVILDGSSLAKALMAKRDWVHAQINLFNDHPPRVSDLRTFLVECRRLFDVTGCLLKDRLVARSAGVRLTTKFASDAARARLKIPILDAFESGLNFLVLGEAGAGKTTSLQMYAFNHIDDPERLVLYVPLGRMVKSWTQRRGRLEASFLSHPLEEGIASFFSSLGTQISSSSLLEDLLSRRSSVLLDGIDEAIRFAPWIIEAMTNFAEANQNIQIIASSRTSGSYVEDIPFIAISLLPFTEQQRHRFVAKWFRDNKTHAQHVSNHLKRNEKISEVVKTPLLATILCVLEENAIPLPESEVRLYEERLRLLLGDYDVHKQVSRLSSKRHHLELMARKIAFRLHSKGEREADRDQLYELSRKALNKDVGLEASQTIVDELVDPCNILVPMTEDGKLGFGHLVYQEYLAARELLVNRAINLTSIIGNPWWRGALKLFSRMSDDIEWFVSSIPYDLLSLKDVRDSIFEMIAARTPRERPILKDIVKKNIEWGLKDYLYQDLLYSERDLATTLDDFSDYFDSDLGE